MSGVTLKNVVKRYGDVQVIYVRCIMHGIRRSGFSRRVLQQRMRGQNEAFLAQNKKLREHVVKVLEAGWRSFGGTRGASVEQGAKCE